MARCMVGWLDNFCHSDVFVCIAGWLVFSACLDLNECLVINKLILNLFRSAMFPKTLPRAAIRRSMQIEKHGRESEMQKASLAGKFS